MSGSRLQSSNVDRPLSYIKTTVYTYCPGGAGFGAFTMYASRSGRFDRWVKTSCKNPWVVVGAFFEAKSGGWDEPFFTVNETTGAGDTGGLVHTVASPWYQPSTAPRSGTTRSPGVVSASASGSMLRTPS